MALRAPALRISSPIAPTGRASAPSNRYHGSLPAAFLTLLLAGAFVALARARVQGQLNRIDLRIVAHIVPERAHLRLLRDIHPLVHLGDAALVIPLALLAMTLLYLRGYRRAWAVLLIGLSWPIELGCKALLPQPDALGYSQNSLQLSDLVPGTGSAQVLQWLGHAAPGALDRLVRHAGETVVALNSTFPSGSTSRGAYVLGLLIWASLRLRIVVLSEALALALLAPLAGLGFAVVLFAWHWPSDVLGGYLLGACLLATALAILRRPSEHRPPPYFSEGDPRESTAMNAS